MPEDRAPERKDERPRLTIRRDGELPLEFHSSREERLRRPDAPRPKGARQSFFRRNRRLLIIFGNVVLLLILVVLWKRPGAEAGAGARIGPYSLTLQGLRFQDTVYATVTVKNSGASERGAKQAEGRISVRFTLKGASEGYLQSAALPPSPGQEVVVGEAIPVVEGQAEARELGAEVAIGTETRLLRRMIKE
jgi:hypothetical protein